MVPTINTTYERTITFLNFLPSRTFTENLREFPLQRLQWTSRSFNDLIATVHFSINGTRKIATNLSLSISTHRRFTFWFSQDHSFKDTRQKKLQFFFSLLWIPSSTISTSKRKNNIFFSLSFSQPSTLLSLKRRKMGKYFLGIKMTEQTVLWIWRC